MGARLSTKRRRSSNTAPRGVEQTLSNNSSSTAVSQSTGSNRRHHNVSNSTYWFPNDDEEMDRLISQHFAVKSLFGGNILEKGMPYLPTPLNEGAKVLDLACGPGTWLMDVATEYPEAECVGIDMCDVFPKEIRPSNVKFQVANMLEGLPFPDNTFDFVHMRLLLIGVKKDEWPELFKEVFRVLKPGGCAQSVEAGMLQGGDEFVQKAGEAFTNMMLSRDQDPYISHKLDKVMRDAKFEIIHFERKDIYLGRQDPLWKEFWADVCTIFAGVERFIGPALNIPPDAYPQFVRDLGVHFQNMAVPEESKWSYGLCFAQKPK